MNECPTRKKIFKHTKTVQYCITQREYGFYRSRSENSNKYIEDLKLEQKNHQDLQEFLLFLVI